MSQIVTERTAAIPFNTGLLDRLMDEAGIQLENKQSTARCLGAG